MRVLYFALVGASDRVSRNVSACDETYRAVNAPHVFDI